jgi:hypothetical protein
MRAATARPARAGTPWKAAWVVHRGHEERRGLGRARLGPNGPPDDPDQVQDRQLEDEHQEDDLDHAPILGVISTE